MVTLQAIRDAAKSYPQDTRFTVVKIPKKFEEDREGVILSWTDLDTGYYNTHVEKLLKLTGYNEFCICARDGGGVDLWLWRRKKSQS